MVFESHYAYLIGAVCLIVACLLSVAITFFGWWELGRKMTLSPIEIARSFSAPLLIRSDISTSSALDTLLENIGNTKVRYGEVMADAPKSGLAFGPA